MIAQLGMQSLSNTILNLPKFRTRTRSSNAQLFRLYQDYKIFQGFYTRALYLQVN